MNVFLPIAATDDDSVTTQARVPFGYALHGVTHARHHDLLMSGYRLQGWSTRECCLAASQLYYPTVSLRYWVYIDDLRALCVKYPGRDWLTINEPNVTSQSMMWPQDWAGPNKEWARIIHAGGGRMLGPNIAIQPPEEQAPWIHWREWLDRLLAVPGVVLPDVWAIHNYSPTAAMWQQQYDEFQAWNAAKGGSRPVVYSETGYTREVFNHVCQLRDPRIEAILWFTDRPEDWIAP